MGTFEELASVSVNGHTEKKKSGSVKDEKTGKWVDNYLTYLSWPYAWAETKKRFENVAYTIWKDENGLPYTYDDKTGYMVYTSITIDGITHEMWLPVMDGANKAMKATPYTYATKSGEKTVEAATMFDINKTIMRCLVKNLAMFGLGLYIYAGEDLPDDMEKETAKESKAKPSEQTQTIEYAKLKATVLGYVNKHYNEEQVKTICKKYEVAKINDLSAENCQDFMALLKAQGKDINE